MTQRMGFTFLVALAVGGSQMAGAAQSGQAIVASQTMELRGDVSLIGGTFPIRFFNRIGATEVDPDTVCNKAGHMALDLVFGEL